MTMEIGSALELVSNDPRPFLSLKTVSPLWTFHSQVPNLAFKNATQSRPLPETGLLSSRGPPLLPGPTRHQQNISPASMALAGKTPVTAITIGSPLSTRCRRLVLPCANGPGLSHHAQPMHRFKPWTDIPVLRPELPK